MRLVEACSAFWSRTKTDPAGESAEMRGWDHLAARAQNRMEGVTRSGPQTRQENHETCKVPKGNAVPSLDAARPKT